MHPFTDVGLYKIDHPLCHRLRFSNNDALGESDEFSEPWNLRSHQDVHCSSMVISY
jgi:hypothetical protein